MPDENGKQEIPATMVVLHPEQIGPLIVQLTRIADALEARNRLEAAAARGETPPEEDPEDVFRREAEGAGLLAEDEAPESP